MLSYQRSIETASINKSGLFANIMQYAKITHGELPKKRNKGPRSACLCTTRAMRPPRAAKFRGHHFRGKEILVIIYNWN